MKRILLVILVVVFSLGNSCSIKGAKEMKTKQKKPLVVLNGKISVKGNEPHTWLCLTNSEGKDYRLGGKLAEQIRDRFQQQIVTIEGEVLSTSNISLIPSGFRVVRIIKAPYIPKD